MQKFEVAGEVGPAVAVWYCTHFQSGPVLNRSCTWDDFHLKLRFESLRPQVAAVLRYEQICTGRHVPELANSLQSCFDFCDEDGGPSCVVNENMV